MVMDKDYCSFDCTVGFFFEKKMIYFIFLNFLPHCESSEKVQFSEAAQKFASKALSFFCLLKKQIFHTVPNEQKS